MFLRDEGSQQRDAYRYIDFTVITRALKADVVFLRPPHRKGCMDAPSQKQITQMLVDWGNGDQAALEKLTPLVYNELHRLARSYMGRERPGHTLQTSALVNEAYLRLIDWKKIQWQNRAHFFAVSAQLMRRILVDFARSRNYAKRGGAAPKVSLDEATVISREKGADLVALDDALDSLAHLNERQSRVVELRFFGGLELEEIAEVMKVSVGTVRRDWSLARAWLHRELSSGRDSSLTTEE
jgi:RNA polymerase sigma factor (TIGR02999 family)